MNPAAAEVLTGARCWAVVEADCAEALRALPENGVDAVVTDPPYALGFMGVAWDTFRKGGESRQRDADFDVVRSHEHPRDATEQAGIRAKTARAFYAQSLCWASEALRVLKPGGHLVAFGGTRTWHRLACALEDAGFELRDTLCWLYGSGFPKSLDVSKAIDKAEGVEREDKYEGAFARCAGPTGNKRCETCGKWLVSGTPCRCPRPQDAAVTETARAWQGWGTAMKPAWEPILLARKPLSEPTVAANVLRWGTGALNIDGCRVAADYVSEPGRGPTWLRSGKDAKPHDRDCQVPDNRAASTVADRISLLGRWPANVVLDAAAAALLDAQSGERPTSSGSVVKRESGLGYKGKMVAYGDAGGASRFFYCPKADREERDIGLGREFPKQMLRWSSGDQNPGTFQADGTDKYARNFHPTVKPIALMQWLCRLVSPPSGLVLDPFAGSGSTGIAALREGFRFLGVEREPDYCRIARARIVGDAPLLNQVVVAP